MSLTTGLSVRKEPPPDAGVKSVGAKGALKNTSDGLLEAPDKKRWDLNTAQFVGSDGAGDALMSVTLLLS